MNFEEIKKYIEDNLMYFNYTYLKTCKVYTENGNSKGI
jgi:hypothetical protein